MLDTIGRQSRVLTHSTGKRVTLTPYRMQILQAIHDHGPLNTPIIHAFLNGKDSNYAATSSILKDLSREENTEHGGPYLSRPFSQNQTYNARANYLVFDLAPAGIKALRENGLYSDARPTGRNPWRHAFMSSHITACIELGVRKAGFKYIPQHVLLADKDLPVDVSYEWDGSQRTAKLIPDALFAIDYGGKFRAFCLEADRSTEPIAPSTDQRKSFKKNLRQYQQFIGKLKYKEAYGLNCGLVVLVVSVSQTRANAFLKVTEQELPKGCSYISVQACPDFANIFKPPAVLTQFTDKSWDRSGFVPLDILTP